MTVLQMMKIIIGLSKYEPLNKDRENQFNCKVDLRIIVIFLSSMIWNRGVLLQCSPMGEEYVDAGQSYIGGENLCDANNQDNLILAYDENRVLGSYRGRKQNS